MQLVEKDPKSCLILDYGYQENDKRYKVPKDLEPFVPRELCKMRYRMKLYPDADISEIEKVGSVLQPFSGVYWNGPTLTSQGEWAIYLSNIAPLVCRVTVPAVATPQKDDAENIEGVYAYRAQKLANLIVTGRELACVIREHLFKPAL